MNLTKSNEFFNPADDQSRIHIIGCGSVGSTIAEGLARCGVSKITLWDFDKVEAKNVHNQMFYDRQIGQPKVEALRDIIMEINPDIPEGDIKLKPEGWKGEMLSGYVFLAVDNIEIRKDIVKQHFDNMNIRAMFDVRTGLTDAQSYGADWGSLTDKEAFFSTMDFTHEEAAEATPVSACGVTLGIVTTVRLISALAVNNYIKFTKGEQIWKIILMDGFSGNFTFI